MASLCKRLLGQLPLSALWIKKGRLYAPPMDVSRSKQHFSDHNISFHRELQVFGSGPLYVTMFWVGSKQERTVHAVVDCENGTPRIGHQLMI